jgi:hypothetical protein
MNVNKLVEYYKNPVATRYLDKNELEFMCKIYEIMTNVHARHNFNYHLIENETDENVVDFLKLIGMNADFLADDHSEILGIQIRW